MVLSLPLLHIAYCSPGVQILQAAGKSPNGDGAELQCTDVAGWIWTSSGAATVALQNKIYTIINKGQRVTFTLQSGIISFKLKIEGQHSRSETPRSDGSNKQSEMLYSTCSSVCHDCLRMKNPCQLYLKTRHTNMSFSLWCEGSTHTQR